MAERYAPTPMLAVARMERGSQGVEVPCNETDRRAEPGDGVLTVSAPLGSVVSSLDEQNIIMICH